MLAAIHVRKQRLHFDDATYRSFLESRTGVRSAAELSVEQLALVLDALKAFAMPAPPRQKGPEEPQLALLRSLWADAFFHGCVKSPSERALTRFVRRITSVDAIPWLTATDANKPIEALKIMIARARGQGNSHSET